MPISYRTYTGRYGNNDRGADGISITTSAGDTCLAMWFHPWANPGYFNFDDSAFPTYVNNTSWEIGLVTPSSTGSHHIDAYCDNGGPNILMVWYLLNVKPSTITGYNAASYNPGWGGVSTNVTTKAGGFVGAICMMGWYSDAWGWGCWFNGSETTLLSYGGSYNNSVGAGGYELSTTTSTNISCDTTFSAGDPDVAYVLGVSVEELLTPGAPTKVLSPRGILTRGRSALRRRQPWGYG